MLSLTRHQDHQSIILNHQCAVKNYASNSRDGKTIGPGENPLGATNFRPVLPFFQPCYSARNSSCPAFSSLAGLHHDVSAPASR